MRFQLDLRLGEAALNAGAKELQVQRTELFEVSEERGGGVFGGVFFDVFFVFGIVWWCFCWVVIVFLWVVNFF